MLKEVMMVDKVISSDCVSAIIATYLSSAANLGRNLSSLSKNSSIRIFWFDVVNHDPGVLLKSDGSKCSWESPSYMEHTIILHDRILYNLTRAY
jgi:hypothetical protein